MWVFIGVEYLCYNNNNKILFYSANIQFKKNLFNTLNQVALRRLLEHHFYQTLLTHHTIYNHHKTLIPTPLLPPKPWSKSSVVKVTGHCSYLFTHAKVGCRGLNTNFD